MGNRSFLRRGNAYTWRLREGRSSSSTSRLHGTARSACTVVAHPASHGSETDGTGLRKQPIVRWCQLSDRNGKSNVPSAPSRTPSLPSIVFSRPLFQPKRGPNEAVPPLSKLSTLSAVSVFFIHAGLCTGYPAITPLHFVVACFFKGEGFLVKPRSVLPTAYIPVPVRQPSSPNHPS
ncbi:unnamed protein product [Ectocarpus fasciculatus]